MCQAERMAEWSRRESNPRPLECHASSGLPWPSANVRECPSDRLFVAFARIVGNVHGSSDSHTTATRQRDGTVIVTIAAGDVVEDAVDVAVEWPRRCILFHHFGTSHLSQRGSTRSVSRSSGNTGQRSGQYHSPNSVRYREPGSWGHKETASWWSRCSWRRSW